MCYSHPTRLIYKYLRDASGDQFRAILWRNEQKSKEKTTHKKDLKPESKEKGVWVKSMILQWEENEWGGVGE